MEIVQRILNKIVGEELSSEEMEMIAGGLADACPDSSCKTWQDGNYTVAACDC